MIFCAHRLVILMSMVVVPTGASARFFCAGILCVSEICGGKKAVCIIVGLLVAVVITSMNK